MQRRRNLIDGQTSVLIYFHLLPFTGHTKSAPRGDSNDKVVQILTLSCDRGVIQWSQPSGALQIRFKPRRTVPVSKLCLRIDTLNDELVTARVTDHKGEVSKRIPARTVLCVNNEHFKLLIVESKNPNPWTKPVLARILYEMSTVDLKSYHQKKTGEFSFAKNFKESVPVLAVKAYVAGYNHCKQCTVQDIADTFCKADLVFEAQRSQIKSKLATIIVKRIIRRPLFYAEIVNHQKSLEIALDCFFKNIQESRIIIAETLLGNVSIMCAPTVQYFQKAIKLLGDNAPCQMT
uniref:Myosin motor domain-containing protein n=1 Tax=Syphacia muris TaxID=451379 RepID=A0A0N5AES3_9BILA